MLATVFRPFATDAHHHARTNPSKSSSVLVALPPRVATKPRRRATSEQAIYLWKPGRPPKKSQHAVTHPAPPPTNPNPKPEVLSAGTTKEYGHNVGSELPRRLRMPPEKHHGTNINGSVRVHAARLDSSPRV